MGVVKKTADKNDLVLEVGITKTTGLAATICGTVIWLTPYQSTVQTAYTEFAMA